MQIITSVVFACAALSALAARESQHAGVHSPVQKVLQMMGDMKNKAIAEKNNEEVMFSKFKSWCGNTEKSKTKAIADGEDSYEQLSADITKFDSDSKVLSEEIAKLDESIDLAEKDKAAAIALREKEHADFEATHAEYEENLADLQNAMTKIKSMMAENPAASAASLLQKLANGPELLPATKNYVTAFLAESSGADQAVADGLEATAPEAAAYESQSGGIVDMMVSLEDKLKDEKSTLEKEESDKSHAHNMMVGSLTNQIKEDTDSRNKKVSQKQAAEQGSAKAKGDLEDTKSTLEEDGKYLSDLKVMCETKSSEFAARQKLRAEELEALDKAMEIIAEGAAPHADKAFLQTGTALVQLRSTVTQPQQTQVASFLAEAASRSGSNLLAALAVHAAQDPFAKVKKMIKDMVFKLMEEATEEAEHKGFCDTELGTNKITRDAKTADSEELSAQIEGLSAEIKKLTMEIADLSDQVTAIDTAVAQMTTERAEEKAKNQKTLEDALQAKTAVENAMAVLKQFYDKAAQATALNQGSIDYDDRALNILHKQRGASLLQTRGPGDEAPATFSKPFKGSGGEGGILGMLEVILSDFERLEVETNEAEHAAKEEFDAFSADSAEDKAVKNAGIKHKTNKKTMAESDLATAKKDLKSTQEELDAALEYYEKLKPSCVDAGESYEERVARRKAEIESLQEALKILTP